VEADAGPHADDKVAEEEGNNFDGVDGMGVEPEEALHGTGEGDADEEGIDDFLLESAPASDNASWGCDHYRLVQPGDSQCERSISLSLLR
jgi:hypothetical protein